MKPLRLFCPAEDSSWSQSIQTERELQICKDIATRLGLPINLDEAAGKLYLGHAKDWQPSPPTGKRSINSTALALIKESEGCVLTAYRDPVGILTIGYGHTGPDVTSGLQINMAEADALLKEDLAKFEAGVADLVKVPITDNQFGALVSFAYNLGLGALGESTLLRKLNAGDYSGASEEFPKWVNAGGQKLPGLVTRRERERKLFAATTVSPAKAASVESKVKAQAQHRPDSCGQTSVAMAINCLTGKSHTDETINAKYGYDLLPALNSECSSHVWGTPDFTAQSWPLIQASLESGRPVLFAANGPDFSRSGRGHILLIVALTADGKVRMADPATGTAPTWTRAQCETAAPHPQGKWLMVARPK